MYCMYVCTVCILCDTACCVYYVQCIVNIRTYVHVYVACMLHLLYTVCSVSTVLSAHTLRSL